MKFYFNFSNKVFIIEILSVLKRQIRFPNSIFGILSLVLDPYSQNTVIDSCLIKTLFTHNDKNRNGIKTLHVVRNGNGTNTLEHSCYNWRIFIAFFCALRVVSLAWWIFQLNSHRDFVTRENNAESHVVCISRSSVFSLSLSLYSE